MADFDPDAYLNKKKDKDQTTKFDPDAYLKKTTPESALQSFGRGTASLADTALNALTGTLDYAAYPLARAYYGTVGGMTPEQAAQRAQQETTSPKDVVGRASGVAGTRGYEQAPLRAIGTKIGQGLEQGVIQPIASRTGLPEQDVSSMFGSAAMAAGPAIPKVVQPVAQTFKSATDVVKSAPEFTRGALGQISGGGTRPGQRATYAGQYESARQPVGTSYHTPENLQAWRDILISTDELNKRSQPFSPEQQAALRKTKGMVPYQGQAARAAGEALVEPYTRLSGYIPDIALAGIGALAAGPLGAAALPAINMARRGVGLYQAGKTAGAMRQLGDLGFSPLYPEELAAISRGQPHPSAIPGFDPSTPKTPYPTWASPTTPPGGNPPPPAGGAGAPRANTQAQQAATQQGIAPPMTAEQSGFTQQLNTMASGPAVPTKLPEPIPEPTVQRVAPTPMAEPIPEPTVQRVAPTPMAETPPMMAPAELPNTATPAPIRNTGPHENTQAIEQALTTKVAANPALEEFTKTYAKHPSVAQPINDFLSGNTKDAVVYGAPGTGKTFLTREWKNQNPTGEIQTIERQTFDAAKLKELKDRSLLVDVPTLYRVEEANTLTPKQVEMLNDLQKATTRNGRMVITTNDYKALDPSLKGGNIAQINMNVVLTPEQRSTYALKVAKDYNVNKTPAEIEAIAQNPNNKSYRKIKDEVSAGYSNKETPFMSEHGDASDALAGKLPNNVLKELDDWNNNLSNNLVIFKNPSSNISKALDSWVPQTSDINVIESALYKNTTASPVFRFVVRSEKDAKDISKLKNAISDSNETKFPTKLIVEDYTGNLDPAIISRGKTYTDKDLANTQQVNKPATGMAALENLSAPGKNAPPGVMSMMTKESAPAGNMGTFENPLPNKQAVVQGQNLFDVMKKESVPSSTWMEGNTKVQRIVEPENNVDMTVKYGKQGNLNKTEITGEGEYGDSIHTIIKSSKPHENIKDQLKTYNIDQVLEGQGLPYSEKTIIKTNAYGTRSVILDNNHSKVIQTLYQPGDTIQGHADLGPVKKPTWVFEQDGLEWLNGSNKTLKTFFNKSKNAPHPLGEDWNKPITIDYSGDVKKPNPFKKK